MKLWMNGKRAAVGVSTLALLATCGVATAGTPDLRMSVDVAVSGGAFDPPTVPGSHFSSGMFNAPLLTNSDPFFEYGVSAATPEINHADFSVDGTINASSDPSSVGLTTSLGFSNTSGGWLDFEVWLEWDVDAGAGIDWDTGLTWANGFNPLGAWSQSLPGQAIWQVYMDDTLVTTIGDDFTILTGGPSQNSFVPDSGLFDQAVETMKIKMAFRINHGTEVTFNGGFDGGEVPAPGALALLGIAGLCGRRRRR